jgi:hypothetical protein
MLILMDDFRGSFLPSTMWVSFDDLHTAPLGHVDLTKDVSAFSHVHFGLFSSLATI